MGINFKSLSGLYTGTKSLFKIGETSLPKFIQAPERAINVELFNISKGGTPFKDMYVFRDKSGNIVRKYIVKQPKVLAEDFERTTTRRLVDRYDYGTNSMNGLVTEDSTRHVDLTLERLKTHQVVREETRIPFDYEQGKYLPENPEHYIRVRDVGTERTVTSKVSDKGIGANPVVSKTVFKQSLNGNTITETSEIAEYSKDKVPKWFKAIREYFIPKGTYTKGIHDFEGVNGELVIRPEYKILSASEGISTRINDPYLFLRLHTNPKQFCSEAEPIIARKVGFIKTNPDLAYYEKTVPKRHANDDWYKYVAEEVEYYGKTPNIRFSNQRGKGGYVHHTDVIQAGRVSGTFREKPIYMAEAVSNPINRHGTRVHALAHESTHLMDGRRMILAQMPVGENISFDKLGYYSWENGFMDRSSISPYAVDALGGWIKPNSREYAEIKKLHDAATRYEVDVNTIAGYENNFLERHANQKADEILADYENTFAIKKHFPNLTIWQLG